MNLTVCCLFVRGEYPYTVEYVSRLRAMVTRWMDRPFRFACLTDQPEAMPEGVEPIVIEKLAGFAYWSKLELFNPKRKWSGRMLYFDLDVLIVAPLAPIVDFLTPFAPFALTADPPMPFQKRKDRYGRQIFRRFNSSVMVWEGGTQTELYQDWTPAVAERLSGDQCWVGEQSAEAVGMSRSWFPRISEVAKNGHVPIEAKVILCKYPKNHVAVKQWPWIESVWNPTEVLVP